MDDVLIVFMGAVAGFGFLWAMSQLFGGFGV